MVSRPDESKQYLGDEYFIFRFEGDADHLVGMRHKLSLNSKVQGQ